MTTISTRLTKSDWHSWKQNCDMYHREVPDPSSSNIATRKKSFFRYKFFKEMLMETSTMYTQSAQCTEIREGEFREREDEAAQNSGASSSTATAFQMQTRGIVTAEDFAVEEEEAASCGSMQRSWSVG